MNMIQWEQSIHLDELDLNILERIEMIQQKQPICQVQENVPVDPASISEIMNLYDDKVNEDQLQHINLVLQEYQSQNGVYQRLMEHLIVISEQLSKLEEDRDRVIVSITAFHKESQMYIRQKKAMIEMEGQTQDYYQHYTSTSKLTNEVESCIKMESTQPIFFEQNVQRLLTEISNGAVFFESKPHFQSSQSQQEQYRSLKKKLIASTKSHLFRALNREFGFTNSRLSKMKFTEVLNLFYPFVLEINDNVLCLQQPNPMKLQFLQIVFPQFIPTLNIFGSSNSMFDEDYERISLSQLKGFFSYLLQKQEIDPDITYLYNDVFKEFYSYCRFSLHKTMNDQVNRSLQNPQQLGSTLIKIKAQLLEQQQQQQESKQLSQEQLEFLKAYRNKQVKSDYIVYESLIAFVFEVFFNESLYIRILFSTNQQHIQDNILNELTKIIGIYTQTIKELISKVTQLDQLQDMAKLGQKLNNNLQLFRDTLIDGQGHYMISTIDSLGINMKQTYIGSFFQLFQQDFLGRIRIELMQRIILQSHIEIQEKIYSFNTRDYMRHYGRLVIHKYQADSQPKSYRLQRSEVFPPVSRGIQLIQHLFQFTEKSTFEQLSGEILRQIINHSREIADAYELKYDSYLFFLKQLLFVTESLSPLGGSFVLKESELDFSGTKAMLIAVISGAVQPDFNWIELTSADKLWSYTTNFFTFIYKGLPRINSYEVDVRENLLSQLKNSAFSFVKDMTFVIGNNVIDFLRKYSYLSHLLQKNEQSQEVLRDFNIIIHRDTITKTYLLFMESLYDFTDEMILKLNNYVENHLFTRFREYIEDIMENCISLLSSFYINVSKHFDGVEYDLFAFKSIEEVHRAVLKKIIFISIVK